MPAIIKPSRLGILTKVEPQRTGGVFVVSALAAFRLHDPADLLTDQALWAMAVKELPSGAMLDVGSPKPQADILFAGHAVAPADAPVQAMRVGVSIADKVIDLAVFGDRFWQRDQQGYRFSEPQPFTAMPIGPAFAFGGAGHGGNPAGLGFMAAQRCERGEAVALPNVEYAQRLIRTIDDQPPSALVGPLAMDDPDRLRLAGTYDSHWLKHLHPGPPPDMDPRIFNMARPHQRLGGYFRGDEAFHAIGMSPDHPSISSQLPAYRVRCIIERTSAPEGLHELTMQIDTLWFLAGVGMGVMIYRGVMPVADADGLDVAAVLLAYERMADEPRPNSHYIAVIRGRADREQAMKYMLPDPLLSPEPDPAEEARRLALRQDYNRSLLEQFHARQSWFARTKAEEAGIPAMLLPDLPPPEPLPFLLPTPEEVAEGRMNLPEIVDGLAKIQLEARARFAPVQDQIDREGFASILRDPKVILAQVLPPDQVEAIGNALDSAQTMIPEEIAANAPETMRPELNDLASRLPALLDNMMPDDDEALREACARFDTTMATAMFAESMAKIGETSLPEPVEARPTAQAVSVLDSILGAPVEARQQIDAAFDRSGVTFGGRKATLEGLLGAAAALTDVPPGGDPLTEADRALKEARQSLVDGQQRLDESLTKVRQISAAPAFPTTPLSAAVAQQFGAYVLSRFGRGESLAGRDFAGANLRDSDFSGVDLSGAFLERADLTGAKLRGARCVQTVFSGATLDGADISGVDLTEANLAAVLARNALFQGSRLQKVVAVGLNCAGSDFSQAALSDLMIYDGDLSRAILRGARIEKLILVKSRATELSADRADLSECQVLETALNGSSFRGARLWRCLFASCGATQLDMTEADLEQSTFVGETDLSGSIFAHARGRKTTWHGTKLTSALFSHGRFEEATFSETDLTAASFRLASLKNSLFGRAKLRGADFMGANLLEAQMRRADLTGASLRACNLYACDLTQAEFAGADLSGANLDKTFLPLVDHAA